MIAICKRTVFCEKAFGAKILILLYKLSADPRQGNISMKNFVEEKGSIKDKVKI